MPLYSQESNIPLDAWKESGEPFIRNYTSREYGADFQNWGIARDKQGIMYFANNHGLLEYDGVSWRLHSIGPYSAIRSIAAGEDDKIYAGFETEFGYFEPDSIGNLQFTSLTPLVDKKYGEYYDFWFTLTVQDTVYFMSGQLLFRWTNRQLTVIKPQGELVHAFIVDNKLYFQQLRFGLTQLIGDSLHRVPSWNSFNGQNGPFLMHPHNNSSILIGTYHKGFYLYDHATLQPFPTLSDSYLKRNRIYTSAALENGLIAVGTQFGGLAIIDRQGNLYKVIDKTAGLQDNSVWYVYPDNQGGLWLALNKGISRVEFPSPLSKFSGNSGLGGVIENVHRHRGTIYAATSEGVRYLDYDDYEKKAPANHPEISGNGYKGRRPVFKTVSGLNFYSFCFLSSGNNLLAGTAQGVFQIKGNQWEQILEGFTGGWQSSFALRQSQIDTNRIYIASRKGIGMLKRSQGKWRSLGWVKDFSTKVLDILEDKKGVLWVKSIQPGITKVENISQTPVDTYKFPANITHYDTAYGLPNEPLTPMFIQNRLVFQGRESTWLFDERNQTFSADTAIRGTQMKDAVFEYHGSIDERGQLWVAVKDKPGRLFASVGMPGVDNAFQWSYRPFLRIQDATAIISIFAENTPNDNSSIAWITSENLFRWDSRIPKRYTVDYPALIRRVAIESDSIIFNGHGVALPPEFAHDENTIHFEFAATSFDAESENQFRTILEGFDKKWSAWSSQTHRDYTNLPKGSYRFLVQAKNIYGHAGKEAAYHFEILAPWYLSWWMYIVYTLLVGSAVFSLVKFRVRQLERKSKELEDVVSQRTKQVVEQRNRLKEQSEKLQEMDRLKSRFFANISHEFRTPLTLILGLLNKYMPQKDVPPTAADYSVMHRNASRLLQLINQLLDLVKLEAGGLRLQAEKQDIVRFLRRIFISFASMGEGKNIRLLFNNSPVTAEAGYSAIYVYFDPDKLEKVFYNLFSNAFKFTPQDGVVKVTVAVGSEAQSAERVALSEKSALRSAPGAMQDFLEIRVSNTGPGIPAQKLPYIFDRFYQAEESGSHEFEGTGIGLALTKELIDLHSGDISVESVENEETTFTIRLLLGKGHLRDEEIITQSAERKGQSAKSAEREALSDYEISNVEVEEIIIQHPESSIEQPETSIQHPVSNNLQPATNNDLPILLIAEDHHDLRDFIRQHLEGDYSIIEAENGKIGVEQAEEHIPDLIISDIMMPEMNGYELCKSIKTNEKTNHIPVILLTAKAARDEKMEGLETGADDYLIKPFDPEELKLRVRNLINTRQQMREKFGAEMLLKPKEISVPSSQKMFLEQLTSIIEDHMDDENFGVESLGEEIGMSRAQIHRKLKAITNQSASEFIRNFRLQRAAELLLKDAGNIAEIAYMVGFNSQAYFTRSFQEAFGCSPSEYRKVKQTT